MTNTAAANVATLERELTWCAEMIDTAISLYFGQECVHRDISELLPPPVDDDPSPYAKLVRQHSMSVSERLILILALAPFLRPQLLDPFLLKNTAMDRGFTEFGGVPDNSRTGFLPSIETAVFILAGENLTRRFALAELFETTHFFYSTGILDFATAGNIATTGFSVFSAPLKIRPEKLAFILTGKESDPPLSTRFPAQRLETALSWDDLVLCDSTMQAAQEILTWTVTAEKLMHDWQLNKFIQPGYRSLFYGPPGAGKKLTASLLGKSAGLSVYKISVALVISASPEDAEAHLERLFALAAVNRWILYLDEADLLSNAGYPDYQSNIPQTIACLWQHINSYPGVVLLAANQKNQFSSALMHRLHSAIHFPAPDAGERLRLWRKAFDNPVRQDSSIDLEKIAEQYEVTGGSVINVLRSACLIALQRGSDIITQDDLLTGIRREMQKTDRLA